MYARGEGAPAPWSGSGLRGAPARNMIPALFMNHAPALLRALAAKVGTPFWLYDARVIRQRIADMQFITRHAGVQARFAMKACPATKVLREMKAGGHLDRRGLGQRSAARAARRVSPRAISRR